MDSSQMRNSIEEAARTAGDFLLKHYGEDLGLAERRSAVKEIVTPYDKAADKLIIDVLQQAHPNHFC